MSVNEISVNINRLDVNRPDYVSFFSHYKHGLGDATFQSLPRQIQDIIVERWILHPGEHIDYRYDVTVDNKKITIKPTEKVESREYMGSHGASIAPGASHGRKGGKSRSKKGKSKRTKRTKRTKRSSRRWISLLFHND